MRVSRACCESSSQCTAGTWLSSFCLKSFPPFLQLPCHEITIFAHLTLFLQLFQNDYRSLAVELSFIYRLISFLEASVINCMCNLLNITSEIFSQNLIKIALGVLQKLHHQIWIFVKHGLKLWFSLKIFSEGSFIAIL